MKTTSIALFLALSAGYLEAASADTIVAKAQQTTKVAAKSTTDADATLAVTPDETEPHKS
ncbi:hypothetical protein [Oceanisphaera psychrotolerans]|uniref:Uncharacterized protein n=1 Tax=Oceanisphaera psychrotolerans TaxID=1414654 RepID=A0A1J4QK29_9GAMM|nr:hypothetical protein [Oceanisphaera psychrotolerans]OIN13800.1 hypothetical protein BFR47_09830 [Oceanisphaera psychrotolerans]